MQITYDKVLDNCENRIHANMENINKYIIKYDWKKCIVERHHKFIKSHIENCGNLIKVSLDLEYSVNDLLSIFLRIESQFELYEKFIKEEFMNKNIINYKKIKPGTGNKEKDKKIIQIFKEINDRRLLKQILSKNTYEIIDKLSLGMTIKEITDNKNKQEYIIQSILGRNKPRCKSEMGLRLLIKK